MSTSLRERFGRPLRLAVIGGGPESWIGRMHRGAAEMDGHWRVVAGVFSSDAARSRTAGASMGFDAARCYGDITELLARERQRKDGVDALAIMTPNDTHYAYAAAALTPAWTWCVTSRSRTTLRRPAIWSRGHTAVAVCSRLPTPTRPTP